MDFAETKALAAIKSANLSPTEHLLLSEFINGAVDPNFAAQFVLRLVNKNHDLSVEETLGGLKESIRLLLTKCGLEQLIFLIEL